MKPLASFDVLVPLTLSMALILTSTPPPSNPPTPLAEGDPENPLELWLATRRLLPGLDAACAMVSYKYEAHLYLIPACVSVGCHIPGGEG